MTGRPVRISIKTTGCKVNQADTAAMVRSVADLPVEWVGAGSDSDIAVINACTVTRAAERDGRNAVYRATRSGDGPVLLTGCMAVRLERQGDVPDFDDRVELAPSIGDQPAFVRRLREAVHVRMAQRDRESPPEAPPRGKPAGSRTRPIIKVQDGCNHACSYCIVPTVRGSSVSVPVSRVAEEVDRARASGASELVLAGVDLSSWGRDLDGDRSLFHLLEGLLARKCGARFRLSSLEPDGLVESLLSLVADSRDLCPHFHVPLQSGSDRILGLMSRPYDAAGFASHVERAHKRIPGLVMGLDVICGFPGETDSDFEATRSFLEGLAFTYLHVFPYSPRPGTTAGLLTDDVPHAIKAERCRILRTMSDDRRVRHATDRTGTIAEVVDIRDRREAGIESLAEDYTRVFRRGGGPVRRDRFTVLVTGSDGPCVTAEVENT